MRKFKFNLDSLQLTKKHNIKLSKTINANIDSRGVRALFYSIIRLSKLKFARRSSKVSVLCACSSQPHSHFAQQASRFAQRAKSGYASLRSSFALRSAIAKAHRFVDLAPASAFTMAEAIIVMTILGIIASLVITNLRPDNYRDGALETLTKKSIEQIDEATKHILHYNSFNGTMNELYLPGENEKFSFSQDFSKTFQLYKKYLTTTRKEYNQSLEKLNEIISSSSNANT